MPVCELVTVLHMVVYDMIMIPMSVFNINDIPFLTGMLWTTRFCNSANEFRCPAEALPFNWRWLATPIDVSRRPTTPRHAPAGLETLCDNVPATPCDAL